MTRNTTLKLLTTAAILLVGIGTYTDIHSFTGGPPAQRVGTPLDGTTTCYQGSGCHPGGLAASAGQTVSITHNVPSTGWLANTNYTMTVTVAGTNLSNVNAQNFGFQATVEKSNNLAKAGTLTAGAGTAVNSNWVNHQNDVLGANHTKSWLFTWRAPASGVGSVKVYAIGNIGAAQGSGNCVFPTSNITIPENVAAPVTLLSFTGTTEANNHNFRWSTANEKNIEIYTLQGYNMDNTWADISVINAYKTTSANEYNHSTEANSAHKYFRLKIQEADGSHNYSQTISLNNAANAKLYYNATAHKLIAENLAEGSTLTLYSIDGKEVFSEKINAAEGITLPADIQNKILVARVMIGSKSVLTQKVFVQ